MAAKYDILDFHKGEGLGFTAALKNRDGTPLGNAANQTVTIRFSASQGGADVVEFSASPQIALTDSSGAVWTFSLSPEDLADIPEDVGYFYNIWSQAASESPILQVYGKVRLLPSIE